MSKARQYGRKRTRKVKVNPETMDLLREQIERFRQKFGRDPGREDPVFFDPASEVPEPLNLDRVNDEVTRAMSAAGLDPIFAYAFRRTGLLVSEDNLRLLRPEDRKAWENACREYQGMTGQGVAGGPHRRRSRAQPR